MAGALLAIVWLNMRSRLPGVHSIAQAMSSASLTWILIAALCQAASLAMFARQQRSLLHAVDVAMSRRRALAVTYARSALAYSMPAGLAVSAAFAFDQYRRSGASKDRAAAVTVLSGIVSILGLGGLCVAGVLGLLVAQPDRTFASHPTVVYVAGSVVALGLIISAWRLRSRRTRPAHRPAAPAPIERQDDIPSGQRARLRRLRTTLAQALSTCRSISGRHWVIASAFAAGAWLFDALCLVAVAMSFRLTIGLFTIVTMYLGVQILLQLPITPGGIGLIEAGLLAGFTHAGVLAAAAAAVVLTYRILSCWAIIPLGGIAWLTLRGQGAELLTPPIDRETPGGPPG